MNYPESKSLGRLMLLDSGLWTLGSGLWALTESYRLKKTNTTLPSENKRTREQGIITTTTVVHF